MLKPPIYELVNKISENLGEDVGKELGNRYSLVLAIAKRARVIAINDELEKSKEVPGSFESRITDKYRAKEIIKPIHKAIDELYEDKIEIYQKSDDEE